MDYLIAEEFPYDGLATMRFAKDRMLVLVGVEDTMADPGLFTYLGLLYHVAHKVGIEALLELTLPAYQITIELVAERLGTRYGFHSIDMLVDIAQRRFLSSVREYGLELITGLDLMDSKHYLSIEYELSLVPTNHLFSDEYGIGDIFGMG